jgi:hypothetical protein
MPSQNFTPNNVWASSTPADEVEELTLESGQTCLAKKLSIDGMIAAGLLAEMDALTASVNKYTRKVKGGNKKADGVEIDQSLLMKDPSGIQSMIKLMDKALPHIVMSPRMVLHFTEETVGKTPVTKKLTPEDRAAILEKYPDTVFTDQVDFSDKAELFNWSAGGLSAMLQFRQ